MRCASSKVGPLWQATEPGEGKDFAKNSATRAAVGRTRALRSVHASARRRGRRLDRGAARRGPPRGRVRGDTCRHGAGRSRRASGRSRVARRSSPRHRRVRGLPRAAGALGRADHHGHGEGRGDRPRRRARARRRRLRRQALRPARARGADPRRRPPHAGPPRGARDARRRRARGRRARTPGDDERARATAHVEGVRPARAARVGARGRRRPPEDPARGVGHHLVRLVEDGRRSRGGAAQEARRPDADRDGAWGRACGCAHDAAAADQLPLARDRRPRDARGAARVHQRARRARPADGEGRAGRRHDRVARGEHRRGRRSDVEPAGDRGARAAVTPPTPGHAS